MYTTTTNLALFTFLGASFWIVVSLVRLIPRRTRTTAKRHLLASVVISVLAISISVFAASNQYRDYGLPNADGLRAAIDAKVRQDAIDRRANEQARAVADAQEKREREAKDIAERTAKRCNDEISAFVMSQHFIKNNLRAPATAQFPYSGDAQIAKTGECTFRVQSYVDAQNGFGALIRSRTQVDMEYFPSSDTWLGRNVVIVE